MIRRTGFVFTAIWVLSEYNEYFSDTGDYCEDSGKKAESFVDGAGCGGVSGVFRAVFEECLQYGCEVIAV